MTVTTTMKNRLPAMKQKRTNQTFNTHMRACTTCQLVLNACIALPTQLGRWPHTAPWGRELTISVSMASEDIFAVDVKPITILSSQSPFCQINLKEGDVLTATLPARHPPCITVPRQLSVPLARLRLA